MDKTSSWAIWQWLQTLYNKSESSKTCVRHRHPHWQVCWNCGHPRHIRWRCFCLNRRCKRQACLCEAQDTIDTICLLTVRGFDVGCVYTNDREVTFEANTTSEDLWLWTVCLQWFLERGTTFHIMAHCDWFSSFASNEMLGLAHL